MKMKTVSKLLMYLAESSAAKLNGGSKLVPPLLYGRSRLMSFAGTLYCQVVAVVLNFRIEILQMPLGSLKIILLIA